MAQVRKARSIESRILLGAIAYLLLVIGASIVAAALHSPQVGLFVCGGGVALLGVAGLVLVWWVSVVQSVNDDAGRLESVAARAQRWQVLSAARKPGRALVDEYDRDPWS
jgi:fucose permease